MKNIFWIKDPESWIVIADLHLTKDYAAEDDDKLIKQLSAYRNFKVLVNGDFLNHHTAFKDAFYYHNHLMYELSKHPDVVFLNGNNDPYISQYDEAVFEDNDHTVWTVKHGHKMPKFLCKFINIFKRYKVRPERECPIKPRTKLYDKWDRKYGLSCTIIAHYHFEYTEIYDFLVMKPRKIYKLSEITNL